MARTSGSTEYSIAAVSKLTGVSCHALRVWERRYGYPIPERSPSGHRRYGSSQVAVLCQLAKLSKTGQSIGELIASYVGGDLSLETAAEPRDERGPAARLIDLLSMGEVIEGEAMLESLAERLSPMELIERVIEPGLIDIGERWFRLECGIFQERWVVSTLNNRLGLMLNRARRDNPKPTRKILIGAVQGDRHEGGVMMASIAMEHAGWRAMPMGVDLPVREFQKAIETIRPDALGISFVLSRNINKRFQELSRIREVPVFVGGRSIVNHQGLARKYGLIPLSGSLSGVPTLIAAELERWKRENALNGSGRLSVSDRAIEP